MKDLEKIRAETQKLKKESGQLFGAINEILFGLDLIGINFVGNPDEYEPEVGPILPRLEECHSKAGVLQIVYEEFARWFGTTGERGSVYETMAEEIWDPKSGGKSVPTKTQVNDVLNSPIATQ